MSTKVLETAGAELRGSCGIPLGKKKKPLPEGHESMYKIKAGRYLLSRRGAVSSAQGSLASVFGMGTGMSSPPWRPA